ncbi:hypothetical protein [Clostridium sp. BJN0013]|uniref:hypothetical protein n=1 Tax=Clostridium sp. BJN0013 TaxID=3236840 RepID=UPI0034C6A06C
MNKIQQLKILKIFLWLILIMLFIPNTSACSKSEMVTNSIKEYINAWEKVIMN